MIVLKIAAKFVSQDSKSSAGGQDRARPYAFDANFPCFENETLQVKSWADEKRLPTAVLG
jgi:hypothetical protein